MHAELRTREVLGPFGPVEEKNAPDVLYTAGDTSLLTEGSRVAIVGSRKATPDGIKRAQAVTRALVQQGTFVGIDPYKDLCASSPNRTLAA
jgi:DNA processing protein